MSPAARFVASAVLETTGLTLLRCTVPDRPGTRLAEVGRLLAVEGINAEFVALATVPPPGQGASLCLGVARDKEESLRRCRSQLEAVLAPGALSWQSGVGMIGVYGPHFKEKAGILEVFLGCLEEASIPVLAAASSISSLCALVADDDLTHARAALKRQFQVPR